MATIVDRADFDVKNQTESIHTGMKGVGTDESTLITILTGYSNKQIQSIRREYKQTYGTDLVEDIEAETSGPFGRALVGLAEERYEYRARLLHEALAGAGTNNQKLADVLAPMEANDVEEVKAKYKKRYGNELEDDVKGDTSGNIARTYVAILTAGRPVSGEVDERKAVEEAQKLYEQGEGKLGTNNDFFREIFCARSWAQLGATLKAYNRQRDGSDIESAVKSEFSGKEEKLYLAMARHALDPTAYYANILKKCVEGIGTNDERLVYTIVLQAEVNLSNVKRSYQSLFSETLATDVAGDTSGDYKKVLLAVIKGNV